MLGMTTILVKNNIVITMDLNRRILSGYQIGSIEVEKKGGKHESVPTPHTQDSVVGHRIHSPTGRDVRDNDR
jgi:hypothetical protein